MQPQGAASDLQSRTHRLVPMGRSPQRRIARASFLCGKKVVRRRAASHEEGGLRRGAAAVGGRGPDGQAVDEHRALDQEVGCGGAQLLSEGAAPDGQAVVEQGSRREQGAKKFGGTAVQGDACSR